MADDKKPSGYLLDEASIVKLRMLSEDYDERNPEKRTERQFLEAQKAPDNYFALPPCGKSIPARVGNTLGSAECCIFKSVDGVLVPYLEEAGKRVRKMVYNVYPYAIRDYIPVTKQKNGTWSNAAGQAVATTTSTTRPPGVPPLTSGGCQGSCLFTVDEAGAWVADPSNSCTAPTTTPQPGACCDVDGLCLDNQRLDQCTGSAYKYFGPGESCSEIQCNPSTTSTSTTTSTTRCSDRECTMVCQEDNFGLLRYAMKPGSSCPAPCSCYGRGDRCLYEDGEIVSKCLNYGTAAPTTTRAPYVPPEEEEEDRDCQCPVPKKIIDGTSTTTTSTTSTTTLVPPCVCYPPEGCPEPGQTCERGSCSPPPSGGVPDIPDCPETTTTSTTTTSTSSTSTTTVACDDPRCRTNTQGQECGTCTYIAGNITRNGCASGCACASILIPDPADPCVIPPVVVRGCSRFPTTSPPPPFCRGTCLWGSNNAGTAWSFAGGGCQGNIPGGCNCPYPPTPPGACRDTTETTCRRGPTPPTTSSPPTTPDPCYHCRPTTSTTSTSTSTSTTNPCTNSCRWVGDGEGGWIPTGSSLTCGPSCYCAPPTAASPDECTRVSTPCGPTTSSTSSTSSTSTSSTSSTSTTTTTTTTTTSTTTTSTTTTTTVLGRCCQPFGSGYICDVRPQSTCTFIGSIWTSGANCDGPAPCPTTTTTSTTTTTTSPPGRCCTPTGGGTFSCSVTNAAGCNAVGAVFTLGLTCDSPCPTTTTTTTTTTSTTTTSTTTTTTPLGRCCLDTSDGSGCSVNCSMTNATLCANSGGIWDGTKNCSSVPDCGAIMLGACCVGGNQCVQDTTSFCCGLILGGVFQGVGTTTCVNCDQA